MTLEEKNTEEKNNGKKKKGLSHKQLNTYLTILSSRSYVISQINKVENLAKFMATNFSCFSKISLKKIDALDPGEFSQILIGYEKSLPLEQTEFFRFFNNVLYYVQETTPSFQLPEDQSLVLEVFHDRVFCQTILDESKINFSYDEFVSKYFIFKAFNFS